MASGTAVGRPQRDDCPFARKRLSPFIKNDLELYLDGFESHMEKKLTATLRNVDIQATVKRDKFSLPYEHERIVKLPLESFMNAVFDYRRVFRPVVKELLDKNVYRIRFYLWTDLFEDTDTRPRIHAGIRYHFRYYVHDDK